MKNNKAQMFALVVVAITIISIAGSAGAAPRMKFCTHWRAKYTDSGVGEDVFSSEDYYDRDAAFTLGELWKSGGSAAIWRNYLDEYGCTPYINVDSNTTYVFKQGTVAGRDGRLFFVNVDGYDYGGTHYWVNNYYTTGNLASSDYRTDFTPAIVSRHANIMPVLGRILKIYSSLNLPVSTTSIQTSYHEERCYIGSYLGGNNVCLVSDEGVNRTAQKFRATHEFGHRQARATSGPNPDGYDHNGENDYFLCTCDHVDISPPPDSPNDVPRTDNSHCLQSKENIEDAAGEGYAHFWSAAVFNNPYSWSCGFGYYKELRDGPTHEIQPTVPIDCSEHVKHLNSWCGSTTNSGKGTEWDWLTFYWQLWTDGSDKLTIAEIDGMWENASSRTWWGWYYSVLNNYGSAKAAHFYNTGSDAGVIH